MIITDFSAYHKLVDFPSGSFFLSTGPLRNRMKYDKLPNMIQEIQHSMNGDGDVVDIVSMGTKQTERGRLTLQGQVDSWVQSIPGSRWFFPATEDVCFPDCLSHHVTQEEREMICNIQQHNKTLVGGDRPTFWTSKRMKSHSSDSLGWWCAQKRTASAMQILFSIYTSPSFHENKNKTTGNWPDWLLIVDDDTWFSPHFLPLAIKKMNEKEQNIAASPALLAWRIEKEPSYHYGGVGLAINRGILQEMDRPIYCKGDFESTVPCQRLKQAGYHTIFRDGSSLIDFFVQLLGRRVSCLHSDWWQGLLIWLAGYRIERMNPYCPDCVDIWDDIAFRVHSKARCGPKLMSCHKMTAKRMDEMTQLTINCSHTNFAQFVPCQQITLGIN